MNLSGKAWYLHQSSLHMYIAYVFRAMLIKQSNMRESNDEIASQAQIRPPYPLDIIFR